MSLGKDLASIRKSQNLTLEDIQNAIKIPLDTIKSIEDESIFTDPSMNKTYVRSFVRSYAKVLKLNDDDVVMALDEVEAGMYSGSLVSGKENIDEYRQPYSPSKPEEKAPETSSTEPVESKPAQKPETEPPKEANKAEPIAPPEINTVNWADMGRKFTTAGKSSKVWLAISFFFIIALLATCIYIFWDDISSVINQNFSANQEQTTSQQSNQEIIIPTPVDSSAIAGESEAPSDSDTQNQSQSTAPNEPIILGDTLTVTVYAAYGQLEPVRITSDLNWRTNPFWVEDGAAYNFDFRDTLLVRGQYSRMLLLFNGHIIENPRQNYFDTAFNSIMITRSVLDQPRYLAPAPDEFPLEIGPPDSTVYRIRY
ncbi:MAG: helix-turn-helix domain-containing protein [Gracilimonas sp.]|uniref:helix-turn-helix domain-containing protein n=1 Tax=Gracilimonas sp. TaxID=1974203 RepID=UPI0019BC66BA|nr:helix-turn-helix domain-containing protein [Gracilimonas sp.]MBD3616467.1 helix-turn-helix domain-containing protein [Gracilimonas sp.]